MTNYATVKPRPHHIFAKVSYLPSTSSPQGLDVIRPPSEDYLPHEIPQILLRRLIAFMSGTYHVPPAYLEPLIPANEADAARRGFQRLRKSGFSPGEAIIELGILSKHKEWFNVPEHSKAEIVSAGCDCIGGAGTCGLVSSSGGEPLDNGYRVFSCDEFYGELYDSDGEGSVHSA